MHPAEAAISPEYGYDGIFDAAWRIRQPSPRNIYATRCIYAHSLRAGHITKPSPVGIVAHRSQLVPTELQQQVTLRVVFVDRDAVNLRGEKIARGHVYIFRSVQTQATGSSARTRRAV